MMRGQFSWRRRKKLRKPSDQMGSFSRNATSTKKMTGEYALDKPQLAAQQVWRRLSTHRHMILKIIAGRPLKMLAMPMAKHRITHRIPVLQRCQPLASLMISTLRPTQGGVRCCGL